MIPPTLPLPPRSPRARTPHRSFGAQAAYCASKGALIPLGKSLAAAWGKDNIQAGWGAGELVG